MDIETDFCVVGAGPAGLTLTLLLLRSGARVTLVERSRSLDRAYRGEILQPGGMAILDDLGMLAPARARGAHVHERFRLMDRGRALIESDYRGLPKPYDHLLSIPQRHILTELLDACRGHAGFAYVEGSKVNGLIREGAAVTGATCDGRGGTHRIRAHCVVGADGRYSKVRRLAGIDDGRLDVFDHDILWFRLPEAGEHQPDVRIRRASGNPVLTYTSYPGRLQVGWMLPHGRYADLTARGLDHIKATVAASLPEHAVQIRRHITGLGDLSLLDVFAARAPRWQCDGLVLLGDSAHTHSPIGAQGINLAIQDAAVLHPILVDSWRAGDAGDAFLGRFAAARGKDIDTVMRIQVMQSKMMLASSGPASVLRPMAASVVSRTPLFRRMFDHIAYGNRDIRVARELFRPGVAG